MRMRGIKALAAAASLAVIGWAGHAAATPSTLTLVSASMDQTYVTNVYMPGAEGAITNGVLFQVANDGGVTSLYGFCIDVFHNMYINETLNFGYLSNQPDGGGVQVNPPQGALLPHQVATITDLVDTGYNLYYGEHPDGVYAADNAESEERLAAIQAAIWYTEDNSYVHPGEYSGDFATYFNEYIGAPGISNAPGVGYDDTRKAGDRVFTIYNFDNQSFAIGWPEAGVPEPATWAMMLTGFLGMGTMLRRQRRAAAATA